MEMMVTCVSRRCVVALLLGASMTLAHSVGAESAPTDAPSASPSAVVPEIPLPEIPAMPDTTLSPPDPERVSGLRSRFDELLALSVDGPLDGPDLGFFLADLDDDVVPVLAAELGVLKERLDGKAAIDLLDDARKAGRKALRKADKKEEDDEDGDWLVFVLSLQKNESDTWRDTVRLYGILRMLEKVGTTPAVRLMVDTYSRFGELVRIDLQRAFARLENRAVPALIEAKQHDARKVRNWARKRLDRMGKVTAGEAVSTTDPIILGDVLRAFGRIADLDATRVILSYCNADRAQLREAARQALGALGEPAEWHIKDVYKNLTGDKPPRDWDWKRAARELFRRYDQQRLSAVYQLMAEGDAARKAGKPAEATAAFDKVLARMPAFPRRAEMVPAYLEQAKVVAGEGKDEQAMLLLRKARRLLPEADEAKATDDQIEAQLTFLEAKALHEAGTPDRFLLERAIELDPGNEEAKAMLTSLEARVVEKQRETRHYGTAIGVGVGALALALLLIRFPRRRREEREPEAPASGIAGVREPLPPSAPPLPSELPSTTQAPADPADPETTPTEPRA